MSLAVARLLPIRSALNSAISQLVRRNSMAWFSLKVLAGLEWIAVSLGIGFG